MKYCTLEPPYGTRDILPAEAAAQRNIKHTLSNLFKRWGYDEVITPTIEYMDILAPRLQDEKSLFKLLNNKNELLTLRNEMTTPIARLVSSRMKDMLLPLKLSYIANIFRLDEIQMGRQCEFYQAGVELMGNKTPASDAEIIALAIESLLQCGIMDFQICIGQAEFLAGILVQCRIADKDQKALKDAIETNNLVLLNQLIDSLSLPKESKRILKELPLLNGKEELLHHVHKFHLSEQSCNALDNLSEVYHLLKAYGVVQYICFDLGIIRDFDYYTGMVFEGYSPMLGFPICGGGRYDRLLEGFGSSMPATGFALGIERILLALKHQNIESSDSKDVYIGYDQNHIYEAIQRAQDFRIEGKITELALHPQSYEEAKSSCVMRGYKSLEYFS